MQWLITSTIHKKPLYETEKIKINSNSYEDGGLKDVDVFTKVIGLQCSRIKKLYNEIFHEWKITPSCLIWTNFYENFKLRRYLESSIRSLKNLPNFYKEMKINWAKYLSCSPYLRSAILSQFFFFWFNSNIKIDAIRGFLSLALQVITTILSVRFFTKMARLNHGIMLNQNTTLKTNWNIVGFN